MNSIFKMKKSISVKNSGAHFTLKISANQRFRDLCLAIPEFKIRVCPLENILFLESNLYATALNI